MSNRSIELDDRIHDYLLSVSLREHPIARKLREATLAMPEHNMQIAPEQGQFMALLLRLIGARQCIEVGVFTGYSSLLLAAALPADGRIVACDINANYTARAQPFWEQAGVAERIDLRIAPAEETLAELLAHEGPERFDFAFIDADKGGYDGYYESCLALLKPGGVMAIDNTLWHGSLADPAITDADTEALRALNLKLHDDERIDLSLIPIGDGLTLCRKR